MIMMWFVFIARNFIEGYSANGKYNIITVLSPSHDEALNKIDQYDLKILSDDVFVFSSGRSVYEAFCNHSKLKEIEKRMGGFGGKTWAEQISYEISNNRLGRRTLVLKEGANQPINRITMPDGTDGLLCIKCSYYYPYVEPNSPEGYICYKHK